MGRVITIENEFNMKTYTIILTMMLIPLLGFASCNTKAETVPVVKITPDSTIKKNIGDTVTDVLFSPKTVTLYQSKNRKKKNDKEVEIANGFVRDTLIRILKPEQTAILQFLLLSDSQNYKIDSVKIKSPYVPLYEFVFVKKKETVQILVSFSDNYWEIRGNNKTICKYNYVCKDQLGRFIDLLYQP